MALIAIHPPTKRSRLPSNTCSGLARFGSTVRTWTSSDTSAADFNTDTRYTYDSFGRLATVTAFGRFGQETGEAPTVYTYDAAGRLDTITLASIPQRLRYFSPSRR